MFFYKLRSQGGVGLVQAVAAAFVVAVAVTGLFVASYTTQHKVRGVFHYKVALLKGLQKFEQIKYNNRLNTGPVNVNGITTGEFIIDNYPDVPVRGYIHPLTVTSYGDIAISQYVKYDEIRLRITWHDGPTFYKNKVLNPQRQLILREDYYYRTDTLVTP
jgi:hypothetical protein